MAGFGDLNLKFPLILAISVFMCSLNMLSRVEHEKSFKTLGPGPTQTSLCSYRIWQEACNLSRAIAMFM